MINWPAVINYDGDDELIYVHSEEEWSREAETLLYNHKEGDRLIDSNGNIFNLGQTQEYIKKPQTSGNHIALQDFIKLVRIHASNTHRCCIEKINFRNIAEGIRLIASMNEHE